MAGAVNDPIVSGRIVQTSRRPVGIPCKSNMYVQQLFNFIRGYSKWQLLSLLYTLWAGFYGLKCKGMASTWNVEN